MSRVNGQAANGRGWGCWPSCDVVPSGTEDLQPFTVSALQAGEDVDVLLRYTQDPNGHFVVQHASSGELHPSFGKTDGWTRARVTEAWDIQNFNPRDFKTWVEIQWSRPIRCNHVSAPSTVTQRVLPEQIRRRYEAAAGSESGEPSSPPSTEASSESEEDFEGGGLLRRPGTLQSATSALLDSVTRQGSQCSHAALVPISPLAHRSSARQECTSGDLCSRHKFYGKHPLQGTGLFCRIQELIEDGEDARSALDEQAPRGTDSEAWTATYTNTEYDTTTRIHVMHLAASLGSVEVMEWILSCFGPEIVNRKAMIKRGTSQTWEPHYTPLMSALFMSQVKAVIWLLNKDADAASTNHDGFTPMHMLALYGLPHVRSEGRLRDMQTVSEKLVERRADLAKSSGALAHRKDANAKHQRKKRPLEIAALKTCAYPKEMLHLLTKSYHCPEQSELFEEVRIIAEANPLGAERLMENFTTNVTGKLKERLIQEVSEAASLGKHIERFSSILRMSPVAGAELLGLLLCEPEVCDPHRYPLPLYNRLPNRVMRCTYQWVHKWDVGAANAKWHQDFIQELPGDPLRHDQVYEVKVRVLAFPGVLNLQLLSILSRVWHYGHNMRIFAQLPVQAIVTCLWSRSMLTFWFTFFRELATLAVLLFLGVFREEKENVVVLRLCRVIISSELLCELWSLTSGLSVCSWLAGMPRATYFFEFHFIGFVQSVLLSMTLWVELPINTPKEKVLCAVNLIMSCYQIVTKLRTVPGLGPLIIAVLRSFAPMQSMFLVLLMVFITFFSAFATIRDHDRDLWYAGLYLYRALFLNDGDATEDLSGFDMGREQNLDFGQQQFTGDDSQLILDVSSVLMVMATFLFTIVLLNLVIGMYAKFYDTMRPRSELLFHQQRAKDCVMYLLFPGFLHLVLGKSLGRYKTRFFLSAAVCILTSGVSLLLPTELLSTLALTLGLLLLQAALTTYICDQESAGKYLWVSYRSDYSKESHLDKTDQELNKVRRQLSKCATQAELHEIKRLIEEALVRSCSFPRTPASRPTAGSSTLVACSRSRETR